MKLIYRQTSMRALVLGSAVLAPLLILLAAFEWGMIRSFVVTSASMSPTLLKGDRVIVDLRDNFRPQVGDIVAFPNPTDPDRYSLVKRIIGLEGDRIAVRSGRLERNEEPWTGPLRLDEGEKIKVPDMEWTVPPDHFFAAGDNINYSLDSFQFGPVPTDLIEGRVRLIFSPFGRIGMVEGFQPES